MDAAEDGRLDDRVEDMAARYVAEMRQFQPHGPYLLGGYCFGGTVAYEMAQQLHAQGERVDLLAMFDNVAPKTGYRRMHWSPLLARRILENFPHWLADFIDLDPDMRRGRVQRKAGRAVAGVRRALGLPAPPLVPAAVADIMDTVADMPLEVSAVLQAHYQAMIAYRPRPYPGQVVVFRSRRQPLFCSHDPALRWHQLALGGVTVHLVSGAHRNILEEPHVRSLATALGGCLETLP